MTFSLHVVPSYGTPFAHILSGKELVVGRSSSSDLVLDDEVVSRTHARLYKEGKAWFIEDMRSHNGTWLNGKKVERPMVIGLGDVIRLSGNVLTVQDAMISSESMSGEYHRSKELYRNASDMLNREAEASLMDERDINLLRRRAERFKVLNAVHLALAKPIKREQLLEIILDRIFEHLRPEESAIFLTDDSGELYPAVVRSLRSGKQRNFLASRSLVEEVFTKGMAALIHDARVDERFSAAESIMTSGVRSLLAAPILDGESNIGMMVLHSKTVVRQFSEDDMALLASIASAAGLRLRNMELVEENAKQLMDTNRTLEEKVTERTRELEEINEEILRTRDQLIVQEKMASLGTLTAGVAHEIRNPLNFVNNFAGLSRDMLGEIKQSMEESKGKIDDAFAASMMQSLDELGENIGYIGEHGERANQIVQSMMELARDQRTGFQESEINELVAEYVSLAYKGLKANNPTLDVKVHEEYDSQLGSCQVATHNIGRVIINLVNNAVEAVMQKQEKHKKGYEPEVSVVTSSHDDRFEISVRDNGFGVSESDRDQIFTPFFTTKPTGGGNIGLGLSISYDIVVTEHRGELLLESEEGEFTCIRAILPMHVAADQDTVPNME